MSLDFQMQQSSYKEELERLSKNMELFYNMHKPPVAAGTIEVGRLFAIKNPAFDIWSRYGGID